MYQSLRKCSWRSTKTIVFQTSFTTFFEPSLRVSASHPFFLSSAIAYRWGQDLFPLVTSDCTLMLESGRKLRPPTMRQLFNKLSDWCLLSNSSFTMLPDMGQRRSDTQHCVWEARRVALLQIPSSCTPAHLLSLFELEYSSSMG